MEFRAKNEERYFECGTALNRILREAPYLSRCSDNKTASLIRPREYAIRYPYMQINRSGMVSWLILDLDHDNPYIWDDRNLPKPNLIVSNRANNHSHLYYAITPVCTSVRARSKPIAYMKAVYRALSLRMDADLSFHSGPVAKTPGHPWWRTSELHNHVYEIGELADYVELESIPPWNEYPDIEDVSHSRHCILFEKLRRYAYSIVANERENGSFEKFSTILESYASEKNNFRKMGFQTDLKFSSIKATVKSVARWTWDRYRFNRRCHKGVMQIDESVPIKVRKKLAANRTHEIRRKKTELKIRTICKQLKEENKKFNQTIIAKLAGFSRQTISRYKYILTEVIAEIRNVITATSNVTYGVYQVTDGFLGLSVDVVNNPNTYVDSS